MAGFLSLQKARAAGCCLRIVRLAAEVRQVRAGRPVSYPSVKQRCGSQIRLGANSSRKHPDRLRRRALPSRKQPPARPSRRACPCVSGGGAEGSDHWSPASLQAIAGRVLRHLRRRMEPGRRRGIHQFPVNQSSAKTGRLGHFCLQALGPDIQRANQAATSSGFGAGAHGGWEPLIRESSDTRLENTSDYGLSRNP